MRTTSVESSVQLMSMARSDRRAAAPVPQNTVQVAAAADSVVISPEATSAASGVTPSVPTASTTPVAVDEPIAPAPAAEPAPAPVKATGHARVAQNIERRAERLIDRAERRIETMMTRLGAEESDALSALRAEFESTVTKLAADYTAGPSAPPSGVIGEIRDAFWSYMNAARESMLNPAPAPTPTDEAPEVDVGGPTNPDVTPDAPTPDADVPVAGEPDMPVLTTSATPVTAAQVIAAYTAGSRLL